MRILKEKSNYDIEFLKLLNLKNKKFSFDYIENKLKNMLSDENCYNKVLCTNIINLFYKKNNNLKNSYTNTVNISNNLYTDIVNNSYTPNNYFYQVTDYSLNILSIFDLSGNEIPFNDLNTLSTSDLSDNEMPLNDQNHNDIVDDLKIFINNNKQLNINTIRNILKIFMVSKKYNIYDEGYHIKNLVI